jgi:hypothetical protein
VTDSKYTIFECLRIPSHKIYVKIAKTLKLLVLKNQKRCAKSFADQRAFQARGVVPGWLLSRSMRLRFGDERARERELVDKRYCSRLSPHYYTLWVPEPSALLAVYFSLHGGGEALRCRARGCKCAGGR